MILTIHYLTTSLVLNNWVLGYLCLNKIENKRDEANHMVIQTQTAVTNELITSHVPKDITPNVFFNPSPVESGYIVPLQTV